MNIGNITNVLKNPVLGNAIGFLFTEGSYSGRGLSGGFEEIQSELMNLLSQAHMPNLSHVIGDLTSWNASTVIKPAITAAVVGYILQEIDLHPTLGNIGKILTSLGINASLGAVIASILHHSSVAYSGEAPGQPYAGHNSYPAGAAYSPLARSNGGYFTMPNVPPMTPTLPTILPASPRP